LALDPSGNTYLTGITTSDDFPVTSRAFQTRRGTGTSSFAAKLNTTGTALVYSTYLGGSTRTDAYGIAVDSLGCAYLTGTTTAADFPITPGAFRAGAKPASQGGDVFVTKLSPDGTDLAYSSKFGGSGPDFGSAIAVDQAGNAYIGGRTQPYGNGRWMDFPTTPDAVQRCAQGNPLAFFAKLDTSGSRLEYASYLGGASGGGSSAGALTLDAQGRVHLAGSTSAASFPVTSGAVQTTFGGPAASFDSTNLFPFAGDAFVARIDLSGAPTRLRVSCQTNAAGLAPNLVSPGEMISLDGSGMGPSAGVSAGLDANGRFPTSLAGTRVFFDGQPAPLLYVRADQINAVAPYGLTGKTATQVQVESQGVTSEPLAVRVTAINPGIFTLDGSGSGQAAALNEDGSVNSSSNPARPGSVMVLYATGAGVLQPAPEDGAIVAGTPPQTPPAAVYLGSGCQAEVLYSGSAPGLVAGAIQVNFRLPSQPQCLRDNIPVVVLFGGAPSQEYATISVP